MAHAGTTASSAPASTRSREAPARSSATSSASASSASPRTSLFRSRDERTAREAGGTLARHESLVFRFDYTQKIRVWGAHPAPDATRPVARVARLNQTSGDAPE